MATDYSPPRRPTRSPSPAVDRSMSPGRERDEATPDQDRQPAKRVRTVNKDEEKARGRRLFGNLLGTLQRFQKDDKTTRQSEAAKRREQVASRIEAKLRSETTLNAEIQEADKELRALKVATDSAEYVLRHRTIALAARHEALAPMARFLVTSSPAAAPFPEPALTAPAPIPLASGPRAEPSKPLYYRPKVLLPEQEAQLSARETDVAALVDAEQAALAAERTDTRARAESSRARIAELAGRLAELRRAKGAAGPARGERGERGAKREREARGGRGAGMDVDGAADEGREAGAGAGTEAEAEAERERERERERDEEGVQIRGDDGDIEVEY